MPDNKIIWEIEEIINQAVRDFGYRVTARPGEIADNATLLYSLSVRPEIELHKQGPIAGALASVSKALPGLLYKGQTVDLRFSEGHLEAL